MRPSGDMVRGETGKRVMAYKAEDGSVLWDEKMGYFNPLILHHDRIITDRAMFSLLTGQPVMRENPLTGNPMPWSYERTKGCGYHIASEHLLTFRSSAAAHCDLELDGGTGHFGGFKSGCTANMVAADGVLNAPEYTRTCLCSYQNQTSLAMVYAPDVEVWTTFPKLEVDGPITRVGMNLGAPGDRRSEEGTLWLEYPVVGGDSPDVAVETVPAQPRRFVHHSSRMLGEGPRWVGASGLEGLETLSLKLVPEPNKKRRYTVRLYFSEPEDLDAGQRIFSVQLQGKTVLDDFDPAAAAGGARKTVCREFADVTVRDALTIELTPSSACPVPVPVLCGVEVFSVG